MIFMDEAGTSLLSTHAVVAGVPVHGDKELVPLEDHCERLAVKHIPANNRNGFVFHIAYFLWHRLFPGQGKMAVGAPRAYHL
jgi:hypothetical protein